MFTRQGAGAGDAGTDDAGLARAAPRQPRSAGGAVPAGASGPSTAGPPALSETSLHRRRQASTATVVAGVVAYLAGFVPALGGGDYDSTLLPHLTIRSVGVAIALVLLIVGVVINRPEKLYPWLLLMVWVFSCTLRALLLHLGVMDLWSGWVVFVVVTLQRVADAAAIFAVVRLRRTARITDIRIEVAIVMLSYVAVVFPFVVEPGWGLFGGAAAYSLAFAVVSPLTYLVSTVLLARLIFIDILRGRAIKLIVLAWSLEAFVDIVAHNTIELSGSAIGTAAFDVLALAPFLVAAASLHPSMHEVTRPVTEVRGDWSVTRASALVLASAVPLIVLAAVSSESRFEGTFVGIFGAVILVLLVARARQAVGAAFESRERLLLQSRTDPLTGLLNRRGLIAQGVSGDGSVGVAYVDVDRFKLFNDVHGHAEGDQLLAEVAQRLAVMGPPVIATARVGGDEFAVLFEAGPDEAVERVEDLLADVFADPFLPASSTIHVTASTGIATEFHVEPDRIEGGNPGVRSSGVEGGAPGEGRLGPIDPSGSPDDALDTSSDPDAIRVEPALSEAAEAFLSGRSNLSRSDRDLLELLRQADIALNYAKASGGGRCRSYDISMHDERARHERVLDLLADIYEDCHFWLDYQAIVDLGSGRVVGAEALARLKCDDYGMIEPVEFIAAAEQQSYIDILGEWVFETATAEVERLGPRLPDRFRVSVNLSPLQLRSDRFLDLARDVAKRRPGAVGHIGIEVTESAVMEQESVERLQEIHRLGYSILLDDFGSAYASPQNLVQLPLDVVKLDRVFTSRIVEDSRSRIVVRHVVAIALEMGLVVVVEGIESTEERDAISQMGDCLGQGFLWDRPAPELARVVEMARR